MVRAFAAAGLVFTALLALACDGGSSGSPTAPDPYPNSLAGSWNGQLSGTRDGEPFSCAVSLGLHEAGSGGFSGSWYAACPDGEGAGAATVAAVEGSMRLHADRPAEPGMVTDGALARCTWSATVRLQRAAVTGTWEPDPDCRDRSLSGGALSLRYVGPG